MLVIGFVCSKETLCIASATFIHMPKFTLIYCLRSHLAMRTVPWLVGNMFFLEHNIHSVAVWFLMENSVLSPAGAQTHFETFMTCPELFPKGCPRAIKVVNMTVLLSCLTGVQQRCLYQG